MITPGNRTRHGIFILLRRLRQPLVVLIGVYAVAVLGFTLIPGVAPDGQPWRMSFLHAFYFVSFLGTTIGLGEIPYPFTDAQRLWATASIYGTVVAWLYGIGALFGVLQDPLFRRILHENGVERAVRRMREPFYLICGYDDTGSRVARELAEDGTRMVVIDIIPERVDTVEVDDLTFSVPALTGDASDPKSLVLAGLSSPHCAGVLALTGNDHINIKIALTARLLNPDVPVLSAARDHASHARMAAAGAEPHHQPLRPVCRAGGHLDPHAQPAGHLQRAHPAARHGHARPARSAPWALAAVRLGPVHAHAAAPAASGWRSRP